MMTSFPPTVTHALPGWRLFWADLELAPGHDDALATLRADVASRARSSYKLDTLSQHPTVAAIRKLFRQAGCDPTRYRPSNEALLRRLLKGEEMPEISPLVDLNNCLSAELAVPVCFMDVRTIEGPFVFRAGEPGESYESLRGPFNLEGKPLLVDAKGPADTPITGGVRVKAREDTTRVWLVAYMPEEATTEECGRQALESLSGEAPVATIHATFVSI
jgi:DNA/RNA-binding domain of Phe-tRNA-synthetase-like protein